MAQTILEIQLKGVKEAQASMQGLSEEILYQKKVQAVLKDEMKKTEKQFDEGKISADDYKKSMAQLNIEFEESKKVQRENTTALKQNIRVSNAEVGTLESKRAVLAKLQKEYSKLNTETEEGARKAAEMSEEIEKLTLDVKEQEKSIGDTRRNVGNYEEAIKDAVGSMIPFGNQLTDIAASGGGVKAAFTALTTGLVSATRAALAFIGTGVGAVIAALAGIGLATKAFIDYNAEVEKTNALISGLTNVSGELVDQIRIQSDAISQVLGVEQEQLVQSAKVLVQQFGLTYEEALNKIQNGLLATNGANEEFLQSIGEYSTFFSQAGFSVKEFSDIINAGFDLGIYTDKLPDALKEADLRLREQTTSTRDALVNAFDEEFTDNLFAAIDSGAITTAEALKQIQIQAEESSIGQQALAQVTADLMAGAGEEAGGALKVFQALTVATQEQTSALDEQGLRMEADIARQQEVAEARDRAFNSDSVQSFMKVLKDLGSFLQKSFFVIVEAFAITIDFSIIKPIEFVIDGFNKLKDAAAASVKPLRNIASSLGLTSKETDKASQSSGQFAKMMEQQKQAVAEAAAAQAQLEANTIAAEQALKDAKDRADEYVGSLRDIVAEQARQPLLMKAEDLFSEQSAEDVNRMLTSVADQIEENANITKVTFGGMKLSVEEFTQLSQDRLNDLEKEENKNSRSSSSRTSTAMSESEKLAKQQAQEALDRIKALNEIVNAETERTLAEEDLIDKRFYDKLRELDLDKDISDMTADELAARTALYAKYNDDIQVIRDKADEEERLANEKRNADNIKAVKDNFDDRLKAIDEGLKMELLVTETAHLNELRDFQGTEEQKLALIKSFQMEQLQLQKDAIAAQIQAIEDAMTFDTADDLLAGLQAGIIDESSEALAELRNALAGINLDIDNLGKDEDGEPQSIAEKLGLSEEKIEKAQEALQLMADGLQVVSMAMEARETERLTRIDQQLQQGVINEEQATRKKEQIQKQFARKQQAIDIGQALINTALGITASFTQKPFTPANFVMAALVGAQGLAQVAMIKKQKFAKGGILNGPSHAQGGIPMFSKGGAFYGEAEGGEAVMTKGVMTNPALASMASAINVAGGGVPFFANGGVLDPIQSATPTDRAADLISAGMKSRQPVLVVEQLRERENSVDVIESLRTIG